MDIEVGEYVRTKRGDIGKIIEITPNYLRKDDGFKIWLNKYDPITKHSKNIIDIIEVRDIIQIKRGLHDDYNFIFICSDEDIIVAKETIEKYAINILTHEQYEANCYRLEENK